jgi:hypothetical protein
MNLLEEIMEVHGRVMGAEYNICTMGQDQDIVMEVLKEVDVLLGKLTAETPHRVKIANGTWTMEHPLRERLQHSLMECPCAQLFVHVNRGLEDGDYILDKYGKVVQ